MTSSLNRFWVLLLWVGLTACDAGMLPEQREVVYFTSLETRVALPEVIATPKRTSSKQDEVFVPIMDGFLRNHEKLVARADIHQQLERIENVFVNSGRYLEIYAIYQKDFKKRGLESHTIERLAWGHVRLGQQKAGRELIDQLIARDPEKANPHFLSGAYYLQWEPKSDESLLGLVKSWETLLEIDPRYVGFEGIGAADIRTQLSRAKTVLKERSIEPKGVSALELAKDKVEQAPRIALAKVETPEPAEVVPAEPTVPVAPLETPEPVQPAAKSPDQLFRLAVARGELLLAEGKANEAEQVFLEAKKLKPNSFAAEFGQLKAGWTLESQRNSVSMRIRKLAKRDDLTARQTYELGLFAFSRMSDKALSKSLWDRTKSLDPALATQLGIDKIK